MSDVAKEYISLIALLLNGQVEPKQFCGQFLTKFKSEGSLPSEEFEILDQLFGDADSYTEDGDLLASDPTFYVNGEQLKARASKAATELANIAGP